MRLGYDLDAVRLFALFGKLRREQPAARVTIDHRIRFVGEGERAVVELAAHVLVDLHERLRTRLVRNPALRTFIEALALDQGELLAEHDVRLFIVEIEIEAVRGEDLVEQKQKVVDPLDLAHGRDERHDILSAQFAHDDVAELSLARLLVIAVQSALFHEPRKRGDELFGPIGMDGTRVGRDDAVRPLGIEPDDVFLPPAPDGKLQFVAVGVLLFAALAGRDGNVDPADLAERIFDERRLESELRAVFKVLELTAAALREHGASGADALLGGR